MTANPSSEIANREIEDFSLVVGGPLFRFFRRAYLTGSALELLKRRILIVTAICWLPLLFLSKWEGHAWGNVVNLPFIFDVDVHARFLLALPLLIAAELVVHRRLSKICKYFKERRLVPDHARPTFDKAVVAANRLRNSVVAEILLLLFVYGVGVFFIRPRYGDVNVVSWQGVLSDGQLHRTLAGWWFTLVSLPFFQFLLCRWYYRVFIWARFLWHVSRIQLNLFPTHPDRSGGLGFLSLTCYAFTPLLLAQGTLLAGMMANKIFYEGAHLSQFKTDVVGLVIAAVLIILVPLLAFSPQLERAKNIGRRELGMLGQFYVEEFHQKWLRGETPRDEPLLGSGDIQSLADLSNSYHALTEMRWVPFTVKTVVLLSTITIAPALPLTLTIVPLDEIVDRLLKIVF